MGKFETAEQLERYTVAQQTKKYMKKARQNIYIPLEKYDLIFDDREVNLFKTLWKENKPLDEIAEEMKRHEIELAVLLLDQGQKGHVKNRSIGVGA